MFAGGIREVADDAVAEAFARFAAHQAAVREPKPWLYKVAFRLASQELRARARSYPIQTGEEGAVRRAGRFEGEVELMQLMDHLSPRLRAVFVLCVVFEYQPQEAAAILGISGIAARVYLHRARQRMREELGSE